MLVADGEVDPADPALQQLRARTQALAGAAAAP
jgi:hypothetical protein